MENLKTVEEYSQEMTRKEFDRFTGDNELCPRHFGLNDTFVDDECSIAMCKECYDKALTGIEFKEPSNSYEEKIQDIYRRTIL